MALQKVRQYMRQLVHFLAIIKGWGMKALGWNFRIFECQQYSLIDAETRYSIELHKKAPTLLLRPLMVV